MEPQVEPQVQVAPEHYSFESYDSLQRWASYWYQIRAALEREPRRVLEVGPGSGVFRSYLQNAGVEVLAADIDETRGPDYVADVSRLDELLPDGERFDIIAAFQILEHIPFERFEPALAGIAKRATHALISLPRNGWQIRWSVALGGLKHSVGFYLPYPYKHRYNEQHHWELDRKHSIRKVTRIMREHFEVEQRFKIRENPYHYMWALRSKRLPD